MSKYSKTLLALLITTSIVVGMVAGGTLGIEQAVPIIMGANIGTTSTALLAVLNMDLAAKKAAFSHFLFNIGGVLLFLPVFLVTGVVYVMLARLAWRRAVAEAPVLEADAAAPGRGRARLAPAGQRCALPPGGGGRAGRSRAGNLRSHPEQVRGPSINLH